MLATRDTVISAPVHFVVPVVLIAGEAFVVQIAVRASVGASMNALTIIGTPAVALSAGIAVFRPIVRVGDAQIVLDDSGIPSHSSVLARVWDCGS